MNTTVFKGTTNKGLSIIIRYPTMDDVPAMQNYINTLSAEKTFIRWQGEQITLQEQENYARMILKKTEDKQAIILNAFYKNTLIAVSNITCSERLADKHVGVFGISVAKEYRGKGVGKLLMQTIIVEAKKQLQDLKILSIGVFADNVIAQKLYKKLGFKQYGRLPNGFDHAGTFVDHVYLYKNL